MCGVWKLLPRKFKRNTDFSRLKEIYGLRFSPTAPPILFVDHKCGPQPGLQLEVAMKVATHCQFFGLPRKARPFNLQSVDVCVWFALQFTGEETRVETPRLGIQSAASDWAAETPACF
jgi:hypothetical protein